MKKYLNMSVLLLIMTGCQIPSETRSSHHASIKIDMQQYETNEERQVIYERIVSIVNQWANESDMYQVSDQSDPVNLLSFTSNSQSDIRELYFKDKLSSEGPMPLQLVVIYDAEDSVQGLQIMFAEGYSKEPTERLAGISRDLYFRLADFEASYNIW